MTVPVYAAVGTFLLVIAVGTYPIPAAVLAGIALTPHVIDWWRTRKAEHANRVR